MKKLLFFGILSVALNWNSVAQDTNSGLNPVEEDFTNLIERSNDYQGYKVVDYNELITLKNKTGQYFSTLNEDIITQKNTIDQQQDQINQLKDDLEATRLELEKVNADKDAITFLGMPFSKGGYMAFMWGIVALLVLALLFFIFRYRQSHSHTVEARNKLQSTEKEFDLYREKALEKEQRLGRLLQDERNKASDK
ncbi:hypothetical protein FK178_00885 [Antarcticibacterium arcticum]|uniref:tRNA (Guanine-N1)-methyltransferase n=1 Tax=Antarcticibacterium arcticum TaxID=2585771 RepID=A0A5B8YEG5_9FLAO|nr:hypothetical protein [Antarcticibacterium arcticum]QED36362.1 hypothetical protein FK178_00885 [Antarcticibacterium arcticum]